jgi:hypothetical protein
MTAIATISTGSNATKDLILLIKSIELFETSKPIIYIATDDKTKPLIDSIKYKGTLKIHSIMNDYTDQTRKMMEATSGKRYESMFHDYTAMKLDIIKIALDDSKLPVFFLDSDICLMAPLPVLPNTIKLGLSPHYIRERDEFLFGRYNAGFLYMNDIRLLDVWRAAIYGSRFFEQAALEDLAKHVITNNADEFIEFGESVNFGWWRMFQSSKTPAEQMARFGINRKVGAGIILDNIPLQSIHTHFTEKEGSTEAFNKFIIAQLLKLERAHKLAQILLKGIQTLRPEDKKDDKKEIKKDDKIKHE